MEDSRLVKHQQTQRRKKRRFLVGALILFIILGSGINVVFADEGVKGMLAGWFDQKKSDAISEIEEALADEQMKQTKRLKEELKIELQGTSEKLQEFTAEEKEQRVKALQDYADELLITLEESEKEEVQAMLESIFLEAKKEMEQVSKGQGK
ncbi:hypothetical protein ACTWPF_16290 [Oceanobacillus sp. M65]|uniref:hypothetical protein n=1 Tax=Oceanobacillus sp. M65 TaxID=3457435 RepID=UPI003FCE811C